MALTTFTNALSYIEAKQLASATEMGYINTILLGAPLLSLLPIVPASEFMEDKFMLKNRATTSTVNKRRLNEQNDGAFVNKFSEAREPLFMYGADVEIDYKLLQMKPYLLDQMMQTELADVALAIGYDIINGLTATDGKALTGLKARLSGDFLMNGSTLNINASSANMLTFLNLFRAAKLRLNPGPGATVVAFVNEALWLAIQNGRDKLGANVVGTGTFDIFNQEVTTLDKTPLVMLRADDVGNEILPFTEASSTCSMYLVAIGGAPAEGSQTLPNGVVVLSNSNTLLDEPKKLENKRLIQVGQDMTVGLRVPPRSAVRVQNLLVTA